MAEAQEVFDTEFDPLPPPVLPHEVEYEASSPLQRVAAMDLDAGGGVAQFAAPEERSQAFMLTLRSRDFAARVRQAADAVRRVLSDNPHTTLQVILDPAEHPERLTLEVYEALLQEFYRQPSYLDRFYSLSPGPPKGAKRIVVLTGDDLPDHDEPEWLTTAADYATVVKACSALPTLAPCGVAGERDGGTDRLARTPAVIPARQL
jgi:hypothetical protein